MLIAQTVVVSVEPEIMDNLVTGVSKVAFSGITLINDSKLSWELSDLDPFRDDIIKAN